MNPTEAAERIDETGHGQRRYVRPVIFALAALAIFCLAVSPQSFWIDEAAAVNKAVQPTLAGWWQLMRTELGSDQQMPLYMAFLWGWEKVFHHGEWVTRASGILWVIVGLWIFAGRRAERWIVAAVGAFTWYCLDEARPYAMQLGASLALFGSIEHLAESPSPGSSNPAQNRTWLTTFAASLVVLSGSSLLGMIWAGAAMAAFLGIQDRRNPLDFLRAHPWLWVTTGLLLTGLAAYYLWTIYSGSGASNVGSTNWRNVVFAASEVLGFSGLGPGRLELRNAGATAVRPYLLPLAAMAVLCGGVAAAGLWHSRKQLFSPRGRYLILMIAGATASLLVIGITKHFRLLGRHFTPVVPAVFWILAEGISMLWQTRQFFRRTLVIASVIVNCASCLSLRFATRHAKDDYRAATAIARTALHDGQTVWWCAAPSGGKVYGLPIPDGVTKPYPGTVVLIWDASSEELARLPKPEVLVVSKPDIFDSSGTLAEFLAQRGYRPADQKQGFVIWHAGERAP